MNSCVLGFNGEHLDPISGTTHLGNGYRTYNPVLMRFDCPDSWSPFGDGGINPYTYCAGDPVNRADPSGHHSFWGWFGIAVGVALGGLLIPFSGGSSVAVALSVVSVATAAVSTGLAVAQQFVEESDPKTAAVLGWAALGTGIISGLSSAALSEVAPGAKSLVSLLKGTSNRPFGGLVIEGLAADKASDAGTALNEVGLLERNGGFRRPLYRADVMPPDHILRNGFRPSEDFSATNRNMIGNKPALIVAERLEGAIRYNKGVLNGRGYIYMIKGEKIRGTSLIDNMWNNREGLAAFFGDNALKENDMSEASDILQGAHYLSEAHVYHDDIRPDMISLVPDNLAKREPVPGEWSKWC